MFTFPHILESFLRNHFEIQSNNKSSSFTLDKFVEFKLSVLNLNGAQNARALCQKNEPERVAHERRGEGEKKW